MWSPLARLDEKLNPASEDELQQKRGIMRDLSPLSFCGKKSLLPFTTSHRPRTLDSIFRLEVTRDGITERLIYFAVLCHRLCSCDISLAGMLSIFHIDPTSHKNIEPSDAQRTKVLPEGHKVAISTRLFSSTPTSLHSSSVLHYVLQHRTPNRY